jgi:hypothetical protein
VDAFIIDENLDDDMSDFDDYAPKASDVQRALLASFETIQHDEVTRQLMAGGRPEVRTPKV